MFPVLCCKHDNRAPTKLVLRAGNISSARLIIILGTLVARDSSIVRNREEMRSIMTLVIVLPNSKETGWYSHITSAYTLKVKSVHFISKIHNIWRPLKYSVQHLKCDIFWLDTFQYKHHLTDANKMYTKYMLTRNILPVQKMIKYFTSESVLILRIITTQQIYVLNLSLLLNCIIHFQAKGRPTCQGPTLYF